MNDDDTPTADELAAFGDDNTPCERFTGIRGRECWMCHHPYHDHTKGPL